MERLRQHARKWFARQTKKEIILPVSVTTAKQRLQLAFASPITISKGLFYATEKYTGQVNDDNELDVQFTLRGRSNMRYSMHGQLFPHPKGTQLLMTVKDEASLVLILAIVLLMFFINPRKGEFLIFVAVVFPPLLIITLSWHLNSAANSISELIYKIVFDQL